MLNSYLFEKYFRIRQEDTYSKLTETDAGVLQGSILGLVSYQYDTAIVGVGEIISKKSP